MSDALAELILFYGASCALLFGPVVNTLLNLVLIGPVVETTVQLAPELRASAAGSFVTAVGGGYSNYIAVSAGQPSQRGMHTPPNACACTHGAK